MDGFCFPQHSVLQVTHMMYMKYMMYMKHKKYMKNMDISVLIPDAENPGIPARVPATHIV